MSAMSAIYLQFTETSVVLKSELQYTAEYWIHLRVTTHPTHPGSQEKMRLRCVIHDLALEFD
jgi:hypothetical protein